MEYGTIPGVEKPISRIIHGTVALHPNSAEREFRLMDEVLEAGCNTFDTAHVYGGGHNERLFGQWVRSRDIRDRVVILAKGAHHNADRRRVTPWDITADLHDTLARMQVDSVDLYVLHRDDPGFPVGPIVESLNEHVRSGKIGAFGGSNWSHSRLEEANAYARDHGLIPFALTNPNLSLAPQIEEPWSNCISISGEAGRAERALYRDTGYPVFAWSALASGFLSGRVSRDLLKPGADPEAVKLYLNEVCHRCYCSEENFERLDRAGILAKNRDVTIPQIAIAYIFSLGLNLWALTASATLDEYRQSAAASEIALSPSEIAWLESGGESPV